VRRDKSDLLAATRAALAWWARTNHSELPGWPTKSIMASALTGHGTRSALNLAEIPSKVEAAVNELYRSEPESRQMILLHYLANGTRRAKMKFLQMSPGTYYAKLERAEYAVKINIGW
jgi:hypothetical protein